MALAIKGRSYVRIQNIQYGHNIIVDEGVDGNSTNVWVRQCDNANDKSSWLFIFFAADYQNRELFPPETLVRMRGVNFDPYLKHFHGGPDRVDAQRGQEGVGSIFRLVFENQLATAIDNQGPLRIQEMTTGRWLREADGRLGLVGAEEDSDRFRIELLAYDDDPANLDKNPRDFCLQACGFRKSFFGTPREAYRAADAFATEVNNSGTYCPIGHASEGKCP